MKLPVNYEKISQQERRRVREEYVRIQNGLCSHCKGPLIEDPIGKDAKLQLNMNLFPKKFLKFPVHLHHNHNTGMTIGAVHCRCNAVLWQYYGE